MSALLFDELRPFLLALGVVLALAPELGPLLRMYVCSNNFDGFPGYLSVINFIGEDYNFIQLGDWVSLALLL